MITSLALPAQAKSNYCAGPSADLVATVKPVRESADHPGDGRDRSASVIDLTRGHVYLAMQLSVASGTLLEITLTIRSGEEFTLCKVGRAVAVCEGADGQWVAACRFILPLTERQLQALG
jgi:hypothetical protein